MSDINDTKDTTDLQPDQEAKPVLSADEQMIQDGFDALLQDYLKSNHRRKVERITKAFNFANQAHAGVKRRSGEPYIMHPRDGAGVHFHLFGFVARCGGRYRIHG